MTILLELLYKKKLNSKEILNLIAEPNNVETIFKSLTTNIAQIFSASSEHAGAQKERALKLYITILTGQDQFHENNLIEYLVQYEIFSAFLQVSFQIWKNLYSRAIRQIRSVTDSILFLGIQTVIHANTSLRCNYDNDVIGQFQETRCK